jgi:hypothetical protein
MNLRVESVGRKREKELKGKDEEGRGMKGCCDEGSLGSVLCHVGYWITTEMRGCPGAVIIHAIHLFSAGVGGFCCSSVVHFIDQHCHT